MFHTEIYTSAITENTLAQVTSLYGSVVPVLNKGFQVPTLNKLMSVAAVGTGAVRVQMQAPSLRPFPYPDFVPVNRGSTFESPVRGGFMPTNPIPLAYTEELDLFAQQNGGTSESIYGMVTFCDGPVVPPPMTKPFTVHWTASATLNAGAWTTVAPILDQALPAGMYNLVGMRTMSATALVTRIVPAMGQVWRPGTTAVQAYDGLDAFGARMGGYGVWLTFQQNVLPGVDIFATSADTSEEGWFDLVYTGPG